MDSKDKVLLSAMEYFLSREKYIDRYVEGEHKWYGDLSTQLPSLSMYEGTIPWYLKRDTTVDKIECNGSN
jgi:hypothetical protein